ncbi:OLC1v1002271C1 [Oldenlandia corymbosa var. corymbosa]|uniref:OLC1v1002271C1 n=1 Tax=Oldenlandia corymbosa var. corymbosa TaxID=529605 RepID=A0AAV1D7X2_OLDCO|nr:OLC1v1002271C1 [Oldenlandia corymbosa var. corymbosa]
MRPLFSSTVYDFPLPKDRKKERKKAMEREFILMFEKAEKAAQEAAAKPGQSPAEDICVAALNFLKDFPVTHALMKSTMVGNRAGLFPRLNQHPSNRIRLACPEVIKTWKNTLESSNQEGNKNNNYSTNGDVDDHGGNTTVQVETGDESMAEVKESILLLYKKATTGAKYVAGDCCSPELLRCLDALKRLKEFPIDIVWATIGRKGLEELKSLRKHRSKSIQSVSSDVIKDWMDKFALGKRNEKNKNHHHGENTDVVVEEKPNKLTRDQSESESDTKKKQREEEKQRILGSLQRTNDRSRDLNREYFAKALLKVGDEVDPTLNERVGSCDPGRIAEMVETELFKAWGDFYGPNKAKYRSLRFNLNDEKNPDFRKKVLLGEFRPEWISRLSSKEMASDARRLEVDMIRKGLMFSTKDDTMLPVSSPTLVF